MTRWRARFGVAFPAITVALLGLAAAEIIGGTWPEPTAVSAVVACLIISPLALVRERPAAVVLLIWGLSSLVFVINGEPQSLAVFFLVEICAYCVGAYVTGWSVAWLGLAFMGLIAVSELEDLAEATFADVSSGLLMGVVAAGMGRLVRSRNRSAQRARREATAALEESAIAVASALAEERGRIARDLHDVVAHSVSLMVVQAAAGRSVLERSPELATEALRTVSAVGSQALDELARLLDVMHDGADPGLRDVPSLAELSRSAGADVVVSVHGDLTGVPPGVDRAAYRIVQESLTNARKHAPGSSVSVDLAVRGSLVELRVRNGAAGGQVATAPSSGYGLLGMRERAALYGGTVEVGPVADDWLVTVHLHLDSGS